MPPTSESMWTVNTDYRIFYSGVWGGKLELVVEGCFCMASTFFIQNVCYKSIKIASF